MPVLDFPNPPLTVGQQYAGSNGTTYQWDGQVWFAADGGITPVGPAGGDLTGYYPNPLIGPLKVTDAKVHDVAWGKLTGVPGTFPPGGAAGGDLLGSSYPNPIIAPGAVTRAKMAPNAPCAPSSYAAVPVNFFLGSTGGVGWTTIVGVAVTTRGGSVFLFASGSLSGTCDAGTGNIGLRLMRNSTTCTASMHNVTGYGVYAPLPGLSWVDPAPPAATYIYTFQAFTEPNCYVISSNVAGGGLIAMEVG